ncbi:AraC family transcriptional regulator [Isobaculum melis]|uniref:Transcriptional regulator, AraC family n=1 Tax=Isobaculum melis TaxID=142588 RepID=A0A1H9QS05_9LACT|nr:AraC family transcriptional regulator [Isobaculum melis]SER63238.1 transcriptional regulator, AraC family [Isobaculum melis]
MEWIDRLEEAIDYIEQHLTEDMDQQKLAQLAGCSYYHFQRVFSYMVGIPLAEYIRKRKLSLAAVDLQQGEKVIDVGLKYGYESPTAFNRAFKQMHEMTPSSAQKEGTMMKSYPRIKFQITVKGAVEMDYRIETKAAFTIIGASIPLSKEIEQNFVEVPKFWQKVATEGTLAKIIPLMNQEPMGVLGVSTGFGQESEELNYYIAVASDKDAPAGLTSYKVPQMTWAIFPGEGSPQAIQELEKKIVTDWLPTSGYEYADGADIEVYLDNNPEHAKFEVWLPVKKA